MKDSFVFAMQSHTRADVCLAARCAPPEPALVDIGRNGASAWPYQPLGDAFGDADADPRCLAALGAGESVSSKAAHAVCQLLDERKVDQVDITI